MSKERWENLEGTFLLSTMPDRVVFYLEGPSPGVDLLIESVIVASVSPDVSLMTHTHIHTLTSLNSDMFST